MGWEEVGWVRWGQKGSRHLSVPKHTQAVPGPRCPQHSSHSLSSSFKSLAGIEFSYLFPAQAMPADVVPLTSHRLKLKT